MSRIIFQDTYIIVVPSFYEVESHVHPMLHLFVNSEPCEVQVNSLPIRGNAIFLASQQKHILESNRLSKLFFLFDPTSHLARQIKENYLNEAPYSAIYTDQLSFIQDIHQKTDEEILILANSILSYFFNATSALSLSDDRITQLIRCIKEGKYFHHSISDIAEELYLSESRLRHLFKDVTGISLKNYILMRQMEYAYKLILNGKNITFAALEAGFSSPAHLAYTCKKHTGISISSVLER